MVLLRQLDRQAQAIGYLVPFNVMFIFLLISYGRIVSQTPGHPNVGFIYTLNDKLVITIFFLLNKPITTKNRTNDSSINIDEIENLKSSQQKPESILGDPKWCEACQIWKPDRTHHCKVCDACVLRMDQ